MSKSIPLRSWIGNLRSNSGKVYTTPPGVVGIPSAAKRPIGGFRGALTGFAFGLAAASAYGFVYLLQEYRRASKSMALSVEELEQSTEKVMQVYARISTIEERLTKIEQIAGSKDEMRRRNGDLVRVYDALHEDVYDVKRKLYDIEQDVNRYFGTSSSRRANGRIV